MDHQQPLITAAEARKRLGLAQPYQLKRLVDKGQLTRIYSDQQSRRGLYIEEEVEKLAQEWREFDEHYIIVA